MNRYPAANKLSLVPVLIPGYIYVPENKNVKVKPLDELVVFGENSYAAFHEQAQRGPMIAPRSFTVENFNELGEERKYILSIQNHNNTEAQCVLFKPVINRTSANYGNPVGVTVTSEFGDYAEVLGEIEANPFYVSKILVYLNTTAPLPTMLQFESREAVNGPTTMRPVAITRNPMSFEVIGEAYLRNAHLNLFAEVRIRVPAQSTMYVEIWKEPSDPRQLSVAAQNALRT